MISQLYSQSGNGLFAPNLGHSHVSAAILKADAVLDEVGLPEPGRKAHMTLECWCRTIIRLLNWQVEHLHCSACRSHACKRCGTQDWMIQLCILSR